jgi:serine/threonine protein phosphatase PrpC
MTNFIWHSYGLTHIGKKRKINQDAFLNLPDNKLWVVADGMGGHKAGEVASASIINSLKSLIPEKTIGSTVKKMVYELLKVNQKLLDLAAEGGGDNEVIGSTVVILLACHQYCVYLWSGDSRIYLFRKGELKQISRDHNHESRLLAEGFSIKEARTYPFAQALTHAIGGEEILYLDAQIQEIRNGDIFLLCSDGLFKEVCNTEIESILKKTSIKESLIHLIELALEREAKDNITMILAQASIPNFLSNKMLQP